MTHAIPSGDCSRPPADPVSYGRIIALALPMMLSMIGYTLMHVFDGVLLARYSEQAIAAAGPAGMLSYLLVSLFNGAASYTSTFVAQYKGAAREEFIGLATWQGIYFGLAAGVLVALLGPPVGRLLFEASGHEAGLIPLEGALFRIMCWAAPAALLASAVSGFFSGRGDMISLMVIQVLGQVVNGLLAWGLIFGRLGLPEMGAVGAPFASLLAQVFVAGALLLLFLRPRFRTAFRTAADARIDREMFSRLIRYGLPTGLRFFVEMAAWTGFLFFVGRLGEESLAATNIAWRLNLLAFFPAIGVSMAVSTLVGQAQGRGAPDDSARATWRGLGVAQLWMLGVCAAFVFLPDVLTAPFSSDGSVRPANGALMGEVRMLLRYVALYSLLDCVNCVVLGALQGAGDTRWPMRAFAGLSSCFLLVMLALDRLHAGLHAEWIAATAFVMVQALIWFLRFRSGCWRTFRIIEPDVPGH